MKFLESDCGTTCGLLFNFMTWFTCLCQVILEYMYISVNVYCFPPKYVACYSSRLVFSTFGVLCIFTLPGINIIVGYILVRVFFISSRFYSTIGTLRGCHPVWGKLLWVNMGNLYGCFHLWVFLLYHWSLCGRNPWMSGMGIYLLNICARYLSNADLTYPSVIYMVHKHHP